MTLMGGAAATETLGYIWTIGGWGAPQKQPRENAVRDNTVNQLHTYVPTPGGYWSGYWLLARVWRVGGGNFNFQTGYHENHC